MYFVIAREFCSISLFWAGMNSLLVCSSQFWGRRTIDKTKIIVIWQLQNEIPKWHISVTIWRWTTIIPFFYLHFSNACPMYCKAVVRNLHQFFGTGHSKLTVLNWFAILSNQAFVVSYCCFDVNFYRASAGIEVCIKRVRANHPFICLVFWFL